VSLQKQIDGRDDVELIVVKGVSPVGKARNEGLSRATGDYIAWVDADDEVGERWLEEIFGALESAPDVVVVGHKWMMNADFGFEKIWRGGDLLGSVLRQDVICSELWNKVTRRVLWEGVWFDDTARTMEDWDVLPCVLAKAKKVVVIERPLYRYYANAGSLTHQADESMQREVFERAIGRIEEIKRLGLWEKYGRAAMSGVSCAVYCCAEQLALAGNAESATMRDAERWLRRRLPALLMVPARVTYKAKWALAAFGLWNVVKWYYAKVQGRKL